MRPYVHGWASARSTLHSQKLSLGRPSRTHAVRPVAAHHGRSFSMFHPDPKRYTDYLCQSTAQGSRCFPGRASLPARLACYPMSLCCSHAEGMPDAQGGSGGWPVCKVWWQVRWSDGRLQTHAASRLQISDHVSSDVQGRSQFFCCTMAIQI